MNTFNSDGVDIAYLDEGAGPAIVLVHGFASTARINWVDTGWVRQLAGAGRRVIALDNRGHGASAKLYRPDDYRIATMVEDVRRLIDHLAIPEADIMGYSMGARITAHLALSHPDRVRTAILAGLGGNMVHPVAGAAAIAAALEAHSLDAVTDPLGRTFRAFADQTKADLAALAACIRAVREPIPAARLAAITCPVLVAVGTHDAIAGPADALAALIPGAMALEITGRDHMKAVGDRIYKDGVAAFLAERSPITTSDGAPRA